MTGGLAVPWALAFLPDGSALVSERDTARIKRVSADGDVTAVGRVDGVRPRRRGRPARASRSPRRTTPTTCVFAYFTAGSDNRIVRMTYDGQRLAGQRTILDGIPAGGIHNGGRIAFGPDGMLYVGTGEAGERGLAQDRDNLGGKILRITADGKPAPDNPFQGSPVYSLGHRNVQGLAWDAQRAAVGGGVRPEHLGRAQPDQGRRQLRLAAGRGPRRRRPVRRPGAAVAHRRGLAQRHRGRRQRGLHGRAARRAALADPASPAGRPARRRRC